MMRGEGQGWGEEELRGRWMPCHAREMRAVAAAGVP